MDGNKSQVGLLNRSSITFIVINILRFLTVVGILLTLAAEIFIIVTDIQGVVQDNKLASTLDVSGTSPSTSVASNASFVSIASTLPSAGQLLAKRAGPGAATSTSGSCNWDYVPQTDVPRHNGGIVFAVIWRFINLFILAVTLLSEIPPPKMGKVNVMRLFEVFFPPLGNGFGVGMLGVILMWIGAGEGSRSLPFFPLVAAWWLFVMGVINVFLGLIYGPKLKTMRSIFGSRSINDGFVDVESGRSLSPSQSNARKVIRIGYPIHDAKSQGFHPESGLGPDVVREQIHFSGPPAYERPAIPNSTSPAVYRSASRASTYTSPASRRGEEVEERSSVEHARRSAETDRSRSRDTQNIGEGSVTMETLRVYGQDGSQ